MHTTLDIPTDTAAPVLVITDIKHLADVVYDLAQTQLIINKAEAEMQARVEIAKKAYDEAIAEHAAKIAPLLSSIEAYAEANKDTLFPLKKGTRTKTFKVLQHALKLQESSSVEAPDKATEIIKALIFNLEVEIQAVHETDPDLATRHAATITALEALIRVPQPELNKQAVKALTDEDAKQLITAQGITIKTADTFKVDLKFTPEAQR